MSVRIEDSFLFSYKVRREDDFNRGFGVRLGILRFGIIHRKVGHPLNRKMGRWGDHKNDWENGRGVIGR